MANNRIRFSNDFVLKDEKIGINTTNPQSLLDVGGVINAEGTVISGVSTLSETNISTLSVSGISTLSETNISTLNVSGVSTLSETSISTLSVSGVSTLSETNISTLSVSGISTLSETSISTLSVSGVSTLSETSISTLSVSGVSTFTGIVTTSSDLYVGGDLYVSDDISFDSFAANSFVVSGIATIKTLNAVSGIITDLSGKNLNYIGVSTLNALNVTDLNVSGISTISNLDIEISSNLNTLNVSGLSTFVGVVTTVNDLYVGEDLDVKRNVLVSGVSTFRNSITGTISTAVRLQTPRTFEITGDVVASPVLFDGTSNVSLAATIQPNSVGLGTDTFGDYVKSISGTENQIAVTGGSGEGSTPVISIPDSPILPGNVTIANDLQVNHDLNVSGNITIGGTTAIIYAQEFIVSDKEIVLGFTTDTNGNEVSNDITANGGGISIASTEGNPLVDFNLVGIHTHPNTYKDIIWVKAGALGAGTTDAWHFNYAVGIGSTQVPNGVIFAAGAIQLTQDNLAVVGNINASGIVTANSFVGDLDGTASFATTAYNLDGFDPATSTVAFAKTSTDVIGGIGSITSLYVSGISTFGNLEIQSNIISSLGELLLDPEPVGINSGKVRIRGNLYVDGETISLSGVDLSGFTVSIASSISSDLVLDGAGIGIGSTDNKKTFIWKYSTDSLASSENIDLFSGKVYKIGGTEVLSSTSLGNNVVDSSLTSVGQLNSLGVSGISTLGTVQISSGIITATSGIVTYYGDYYGTFRGNVDSSVILGVAEYAKVAGVATYAGISTNVIGGISSVTSLNVSGISTLGTVQISSGIVTATSGVVTYYGDGSKLQGVTAFYVDAQINTSDPVYPTLASGVGVNSVGVSTNKLVFVESISSLGIGTTYPTSNLDVRGNAYFSGIITATDFNSASDIKLKTNINQIESPLEKLNQIQGVSFDWISSGKSSMGVIADDLQKVLPELVSDTDPKTVNYNGLIGLLIECVKQQQVEIEELKRKVE